MNEEESLALFALGKEAWNTWAEKMLAERKALEAAGKWSRGTDKHILTDAGQTWRAAAGVNFSEHEFQGKADFSALTFPSDAVFTGAIFQGPAQFEQATFTGAAWFGRSKFLDGATFPRTTFSDYVEFSGVTFSGNVAFLNTIFSNSAHFPETTFSDNTTFTNVTFSGDTWFGDATFPGSVTFDYSKFSGISYFGDTMFSGNSRFNEATFKGNASFVQATFKGNASFVQATFADNAAFWRSVFEGAADFDGARFWKSTSFHAIEGKTAFSLAGVTFLVVPDFIQAHFAEAPRLDNIRIEPPRDSPWTLAGIKDRFKGDPDQAARWRALKRLAIQGQDHAREQEFFKGELKARRWTTDKPWSGVLWFGFFYQWFSDFGRSVLRPFAWWLAGLLGFAYLYLRWAPASADPEAPLSCVAGPGDPWWAAVNLSLRKALVFAGQGSQGKLDQFYDCLYGTHTGQYGVDILAMVQTVFSMAMIFLILLALRNHFRIR